MDDVLKYLKDTLGLSGTVKKAPESLLNKLPLYLIHAYNYSLLEIDGGSFLLAEEENMNPKTAEQLKKQAKAIFHHTDLPAVFVLYNQSMQMRRNMIRNRISFIVPENQLYLPELLIYLKENNRQIHPLSEFLTPSAQLLLLYHLQVEHLEEFSFKEIAEKLGYSPKTITKIAEELKAKKICRVTGTKEKRFAFDVGRKQLWKMSEPQMQAPVIKSYFTGLKDKWNFCKSGDAALAHYTFLSDTGKEAYAVYKVAFEELREKEYWEYLDEIEGDIRIEVWKYNPSLLSNNGYIDPLSLYLCYRDDHNERVEAEMKELIDKNVCCYRT
jgi:DNA-binding Lrp family transcriptional regulator